MKNLVLLLMHEMGYTKRLLLCHVGKVSTRQLDAYSDCVQPHKHRQLQNDVVSDNHSENYDRNVLRQWPAPDWPSDRSDPDQLSASAQIGEFDPKGIHSTASDRCDAGRELYEL